MNKHYIVLNGKRYDATTGALLSDADTAKDIPTTVPTSSKTPKSRTLRDGSSIAHTSTQHAAKKPAKARSAPSHMKHHKTQGGKTLMRRSVKRPVGNDFLTVKRQYPIQEANSSLTIATPKASVHEVDPNRLKRAKAVHKSSHIGKFISQANTPIRPKVAPINVAKPPAHASAKPQAPVSPAPKQNIFEQALTTATSHESTYHSPARKRRTKALKVSTGIAIAVLLVGLTGFVNRQSIEIQVASMRAGFSASAPAYVPSGYQKDTTAVEGKSVSIHYVSPNDETTYSLTQEPSDWNSEALLSTIVTSTGGTYRALQHNGRTIYIYDSNKAAWVDGGVLYTIAGSAPLSTDQITSIAASL